jgi:hypothetical protein
MCGPHAIGTERFVAVSNGASFAQVAGAVLGKQARAQNPDKDALVAEACPASRSSPWSPDGQSDPTPTSRRLRPPNPHHLVPKTTERELWSELVDEPLA